MGVFCDRLKFGSTDQNKGRYCKKELLLLLVSLPTPIQPLCYAVPDLTPQTKEIAMGQIKKENPPQMSCCYGIMVFLGLFASLLTLTLLVIYAGVWTQRSLYGKTNLSNQE